MEQLQQLGIGGIFAILVLREVFLFLGRRRGTGTDDAMRKQVADLHDWHAREDVDGVKIWYVRKSLDESIEKLATAIDQLVKIHSTEMMVLGAIERRLERIDSFQPMRNDG